MAPPPKPPPPGRPLLLLIPLQLPAPQHKHNRLPDRLVQVHQHSGVLILIGRTPSATRWRESWSPTGRLEPGQFVTVVARAFMCVVGDAKGSTICRRGM